MAIVQFLDNTGFVESSYSGYPSATEAIKHFDEAVARLKKGEGHQTAASVVVVEGGKELKRFDVGSASNDVPAPVNANVKTAKTDA